MMAGFGRSFKPPSYLTSMTRRPPAPGRTLSNSSSVEASPLPSPDFRPDDIVFSARTSPNAVIDRPQSPFSREAFYFRPSSDLKPIPQQRLVYQNPEFLQPSDALRTALPKKSVFWSGNAVTGLRVKVQYSSAETLPPFPASCACSPSRNTTSVDETSSSVSPRSTPVRSQPIAIEPPATKKTVNSAPVYTPPAPLSARGDLPGGYFPLHEEQTRVYRPHPFQLDATKARMKSIEQASESTSPETLPIAPVEAGTVQAAAKAPAAMTDRPLKIPHLVLPSHVTSASKSNSPSRSRSNTPVMTYTPTGQDSPMLMGKYYPTNYEKRKDEKRKARGAWLGAPESGQCSSKSDTQVPSIRDPPTSSHTRNESEARRRLQQYQRDMIAQATLALNGGGVNPATLNSLRTLGFSGTSTKPDKPRLAPLGSPGPVTPMELEEIEDGYLGARNAANFQREEIARAIRAEEDMKRREGRSSPVVDLGPSTL